MAPAPPGIFGGDTVCIVLPPPPPPPGPRGPRLEPPTIIWRIREHGGLQVLISDTRPKLGDLQVLDIGRSALSSLDDQTATATTENDEANATSGYGKEHKIDRRQTLLIQSLALKHASNALALQQAAVDRQLEVLLLEDEDGETPDGDEC